MSIVLCPFNYNDNERYVCHVRPRLRLKYITYCVQINRIKYCDDKTIKAL